MKKFLVSLAVVCMVSLLAVCVFAADPAPVGESFITGHVINGDGTVTFTYGNLPAAGGWTEMSIFTENPIAPLTTDGTTQFGEFYNASLARINNAACFDKRVVGAEGSSDALNSVYNFVDGQTYYVVTCFCDGGNWCYSDIPYEFTYTAPTQGGDQGGDQDGDQDTADLSVIAYTVAAITGCGALVVLKKRS